MIPQAARMDRWRKIPVPHSIHLQQWRHLTTVPKIIPVDTSRGGRNRLWFNSDKIRVQPSPQLVTDKRICQARKVRSPAYTSRNNIGCNADRVQLLLRLQSYYRLMQQDMVQH